MLHSENEKDAFNDFFALFAKFCEETTNSMAEVGSENHFTEISHNKLEIKSEYIYNLLEKMRQTPSMYLDYASITRLRMFLMGYGMARGKLGLPLTEQEKEFGRFQSWIQERYKSGTSHGWDRIILFHSLDDKDAFNKFFELLEQFCQGKSVSSS